MDSGDHPLLERLYDALSVVYRESYSKADTAYYHGYREGVTGYSGFRTTWCVPSTPYDFTEQYEMGVADGQSDFIEYEQQK